MAAPRGKAHPNYKHGERANEYDRALTKERNAYFREYMKKRRAATPKHRVDEKWPKPVEFSFDALEDAWMP